MLPRTSNETFSALDFPAIEREARHLRAEALADLLHGVGRTVARLIVRLFHHSGRPAHG